MNRKLQFGLSTVGGAGDYASNRRYRARGAASVRIARLIVLLLALLAMSAALSTVAFAGGQEESTLTDRVVTVIEQKVSQIIEKGQKFVNDLRLVNKVKEIAESNEAKQASHPAENSEQKPPATKLEK